MSLLNFKEIEQANSGEGLQDNFELFARDFLEQIGYTVIEHPSRGADGGVDLIALETRKGIQGQNTEVKWLVSCKHYSHSGKSISPSIEQDIHDRVASNDCNGFIGFYSTLASSGLQDKLKGMVENFSHIIFDYERIEREIIGFDSFKNIFMRYFPESYKNWKELEYHNEPVKLFNYYFEKEYENESVLKGIFQQTENIFKALKNTEKFEDFIKYNSLYYLVEDFDEIMAKFDKTNHLQLPEGLKELLDLKEKVIAEHLESKLTIRVTPKSISGINFTTNAVYHIFDSVLCVNKEKDKELREIYKNLKEMIE